MFKSVFAKYISAFMLIILMSFTVIIAIITTIIGNYSENAKADIVKTAANSCGTYLQSKMQSSGASDLSSLIANSEDDITTMLTVVSSNSDDITVLITDNSGNVILTVGSEKDDIMDGAQIPKTLMDEINNGKVISQTGKIYGIFGEPHLLYAVPVYSGSETSSVCGTVFVCASSVILTELLEVIIKTIVLAILWVMLAALIAVYFISEKVIGPLKEISKAAKRFASGKFDTRVPVRGNDEVAELAVAFNNMAESLDNYEKMRNSFMSNVSHDLRTPMTSISGFIDGILDGVIPPEKHKYYLQIVSSEVKRLSRLVASLLDLSRIQAGERKFNMAPFDICEMGRQILISFEQKINSKKLEVEFDTDGENMYVNADRDAIYQVFYNICDNAVKFSSEGGLFRISVKRLKNKKILVSVYNEGQGISPEDLPYVFERFYKSDKSRGLDKTGVGLGLFISKTIIEAHSGEIWAESEYGKNCCFRFILRSE